NCACHEENMSYVVGLNVTGLSIPPAHVFEMVTPFEGYDFGIGSEDDGRILLDAPNQIARHALRQAARPHEYMHTPGSLREVNRRLAGGVPSSNHNHLFTAA